jgi:hypothetical protein
MSVTVKARTARKPHLCEGCHWTPSLRRVPTILPGHRYLLHTAFPDGPYGEINQSNRPYTNKECVACAEERDLTMRGAHLACCTFCCGDIPCALPFKHGGDHSCRRCGGAR